MHVQPLIESLGMTAAELRGYVIEELDELIAARTPAEEAAELADVLFALHALVFAKTGKHQTLDAVSNVAKLRERLATYGTISKREPRGTSALASLRFGVVHLAGVRVTPAWTGGDGVPKNGTFEELSLLVRNSFRRADEVTNHLVVTFGDCDAIEYHVASPPANDRGAVILCTIPDFLFLRAKSTLRFSDFEEAISLQFAAALRAPALERDAIVHFHSWQSALALASPEMRERIAGLRTLFSPYLTVARLAPLIDGDGFTMQRAAADEAARYERRLVEFCSTCVVECRADADFYAAGGTDARIRIVSFARPQRRQVSATPPKDALRLVAGGRAVREKGFIELCHELRGIARWAERRSLDFEMRFLCRNGDSPSERAYLERLSESADAPELRGRVTIEHRRSIAGLCEVIRNSSALVVPSLYDPYCLMPLHAFAEDRVAFVSLHAGISSNISPSPYVFDPTVPGDLLRAIEAWYERAETLVFTSTDQPYETLYFDEWCR